MKTVSDILSTARAELGNAESPANSNRTKYGKWYGLDGEPWCMMFVQWVFSQCGAASLLPVKTASCRVLMDAAKKAGTWVASGFQPGDVLIYNFGTAARPQYHTGILEAVSGKTYTAIEGNTSYGNDRNGGSVMRRNRYPKNIVGAVRPKYEAETPLALIAQEVLDGKWGNGDKRREQLAAAGHDPKEVQRLVNALCGAGIRVQIVVKTTLNIREKPDNKSNVLDIFGPGVIVYVEEVRPGPGASAWGRVGNGWVSMDYTREVM